MSAGANFTRDVVEARPADEIALITEDADGAVRTWTFGELAAASSSLAGVLVDHGVGRGSVVLTLVGNRIEYVLTVLACLRVGAAALPCTEQLRPRDLELRLRRAQPSAVVCDVRNRDALAVAAPSCPVLYVPDETKLSTGAMPEAVDLGPSDPAFVLFTSGTSGEPKLVAHGQRYVWGQQLQATQWMAAEPGELVWSTAAPGWSKSARNTFLAPWLCGAVALLQDRRFDAAERLATIRRHDVNVLCMAPTEYRLIAAIGPIADVASLRRLITAGEALGTAVVEAWRRDTGLVIADGYGQTETGHLVGVRPGEEAPPGSMGRPLPGVRIEIDGNGGTPTSGGVAGGGELTVDPSTVPTFFLGYDGGETVDGAMWRTGDLVRQDDDGWLFFETRADDVIVSSGYRIGPAEVEATLQRHPAVREVAVVGVPDETRGELVAAVVVVGDGFAASDELARELQEFVKAETAPYKYPRQVRFVNELPKTASGKISRAALRTEPRPPR